MCIQDMERKSPTDFSNSFRYALPLPYGTIKYPIILLILQNFLAGLLLLCLWRVSLPVIIRSFEKMDIDTTVLSLTFQVSVTNMLQVFSSCLVLPIDFGEKHLSPYNNHSLRHALKYYNFHICLMFPAGAKGI